MEELNSILKSVECEGYSNLRAREMGPFLIVDVTLFVHAGTHVEDCESISREAIHKIKEKMPSVSEVLVHVQPLTDDEPVCPYCCCFYCLGGYFEQRQLHIEDSSNNHSNSWFWKN